jgi:hypothetical protein
MEGDALKLLVGGGGRHKVAGWGSVLPNAKQRDESAPGRDSGFQFENPNGGWQLEPARPGSTRVHDRDHFVHHGQKRLVGVAINEDDRLGVRAVHRLRRWRSELMSMKESKLEPKKLRIRHLG